MLETLALLRRCLFGPRRERCTDDPDQGHLFDLPAEPGPEPLEPAPPDDATPPRARPARSPRRARFEHLPHVRIEHDLTEAEKTCSCCGAPKARIGEDESRELEYIPARLEVRVHVLPKYACSKCRDGVASPPVPPKITPGGMAGPGLVAFVVVSKFADHLPLYRLEDILTRHGVHLSRSTLGDWVRDAAIVLEPLAALQRDLVLQSPVIWTDDTPVTVLGGEQPGSTEGRFWAYIGDDEHPYTVYDFTMSRSRDGPAAFLSGYEGFLQADAYRAATTGSSSAPTAASRRWPAGRMRAASSTTRGRMRRGRPTRSWSGSASSTISRTGRWGGRPRSGLALRQRESVPILDRIEAKLDELTGRVLPKSAIGKAVTYARNQWAALRRYTGDGRLTIDNNVSERTLRLQAIGRKNWEFLGSAEAGPRAAVLFTILAGAKRHHLEPWAYLRDVLLRLSAGETDLASLLPDRWAASHPEHVLQHRLDESRRRAARKKATRERRRARKRV